jgi:hypothetical protein
MHLKTSFWFIVLHIFIVPGVEFGARMITIDGKQIKLQIWDTVSIAVMLSVCGLGKYGHTLVCGWQASRNLW